MIIKRFINFIWSIRREFTKYFVVGVSGVAIDIGTLVLLKETFHLLPVIAVMANQLLVMTYNFSLNKYWSFRNREVPHKQLVRYGIVSAINYCLGVTIMYLLNHQLGLDYRVVRLGTVVCMVPANFLLYKYWVYQKSG